MENFKPNLIYNQCKNSSLNLVLAHGAGAPMDSDWMNNLCEVLNKIGVSTIRFEFPYMEKRRKQNKKFPPNRFPILIEHWTNILDFLWEKHEKKLFIGGKSMGGRAASFIDHHAVKGIINFGFPFHAPGKTPGDRISHMKKFHQKMLILQGDRDTMGNKQEINKYNICKKNIQLSFMPDGDHSLRPRVKSGFTLEENIKMAAETCKMFMEKLSI